MRERKIILEELIKYTDNIKELTNELSQFPWDCSEPIIIITVKDILSIMDRYISGEIGIDTLENWANTIECREDIGFENDNLSELIVRLANPVLYEKISIQKMKELKNELICNECSPLANY